MLQSSGRNVSARFLGNAWRRTDETESEQCDHGKLGEGSLIDDAVEQTFCNTAGWWQWSDVVSCPPSYHVRDMKQSVDPNQGGDEGDMTMNGLIFFCSF